ncbi:GspMb/PilO family protein [Gemmobacter nectariphilus]|uniref:GspMb/PilO family protein n=1 Tax=Gemmobacter nectariphilus TaxID=220343 RepID=UPI000481917D|nr:GspMb/PilO family protein [Gemmobacter nectariphilus]
MRLAWYVAGLIGIVAGVSGLVWAITAKSRAGFHGIVLELEQARRQEAALLQRVSDVAGVEDAGGLPEDIGWAGETRAVVELAMQRAVLEAASAARLQVLSFGGVAGGPPGAFLPVSYEAELEGGHDEVARFLHVIEQHRPSFSVSSLWMRQYPADPQDEVARVNLRLVLWGLASEVREP